MKNRALLKVALATCLGTLVTIALICAVMVLLGIAR